MTDIALEQGLVMAESVSNAVAAGNFSSTGRLEKKWKEISKFCDPIKTN